jgi:hypothetical protein
MKKFIFAFLMLLAFNAGAQSTTTNLRTTRYVGMIRVTDPDNVNRRPEDYQRFIFAIVAGNEGGFFVLDSITGELRVFEKIDEYVKSQKTFKITVLVTDNGNPSLGTKSDFYIDVRKYLRFEITTKEKTFIIN